MTPTTCPRCKKPIVMVETKKGYPVARNIGAPHALTCAAGSVPRKNAAHDELVEALTMQGYKPTDAKRLAAEARKRKPTGGLEALLVLALVIRSEEL